MKYCIVGLGEILWDMLPSGKQMGGAPANFAFHAREIGGDIVESRVVSCVGSDPLGTEILTHLDTLSLGTENISVDNQHPTGTVQVKLDDNGKPTYAIMENVAWDYIPEVPEELVNRADAVCFGSLAQRSKCSRNSIQTFLKRVRPNALRIFDINLRQSFYSLEIIENSLNCTDILKINDEELPIVAGLLSISGEENEIMKELTGRYKLRLIVFTKGGNGSVLYSKSKVSSHPGYKVKIADTVGAGDSFTAAIAFGMLRGYELDHLNDCANRIAAFVCSKHGATPKLTDDLKKYFSRR